MKVSVIVATLERPSFQQCTKALKAQGFPRDDYEIIKATGGANEYEARNQGARDAMGEVLAFCDDDCLPPADWLATGWQHFADDPNLAVLDGPLEGNMWKSGWMVLDKEGWGVGANLWVRRHAFLDIGGFEVSWGLNPPPRGWRGDTDLLWRMMGKYRYVHARDVRMVHPGMMQSQWDPRVEERFYLRHRDRCLKAFAPVDPRLCQFVVKNGIEKDPATLEYLTGLLGGFEKQYGLKLL